MVSVGLGLGAMQVLRSNVMQRGVGVFDFTEKSVTTVKVYGSTVIVLQGSGG